MAATALAAQFRIAGVLEFAETENGLAKALISIAGATGELYLQGAQVTAWTPPGASPVLFTSPDSALSRGRAIRGGIPVIFPWFGAHPKIATAPQHGIVRAAPWRLHSVERQPDRLMVRLVIEGRGDPFWPDPFRLVYEVSFGAALGLRLTVQNPAAHPVMFEQALHSYFAISDIGAVSVTGLGGCGFIDKTDGMRRKQQRSQALKFGGETDRVYLDVPNRLAIVDPGHRRITLDKAGAASAVTWNPWAAKAAALGDLGGDLWRRFVCVETGNIADDAIRLSGGSEHVMSVEIGVGAP
ncbi:MAG TPA: D-hexose-6-phosphate mutarotase [Stellaceae bacterium]